MFAQYRGNIALVLLLQVYGSHLQWLSNVS